VRELSCDPADRHLDADWEWVSTLPERDDRFAGRLSEARRRPGTHYSVDR